MTLTIHKHEDDQRQLHLQVAISEEFMDKTMRAKARELARQIRIPGFRPGKAPYGVIVQRFGEEALRYEVLEKVLPELINEAFKQENVEPFAQPVLSNLEITPPSFEVVVPLEPIVELGDYRALRRELPTADVTDEEVENIIQSLLDKEANIETVDRPAQLGDVVIATGVGAKVPVDAAEDWQVDHDADEQIYHDHSGTEFPLDEKRNFFGATFVEKLVGAQAGDELRFNVELEEDDEMSIKAGTLAQFALEIVRVDHHERPTLDDELAQKLGHDSVEALYTAERERLTKRAEQWARQQFFDGMVQDIINEARIVFPPALADERSEERLERFKKQITRYGWKWEDYLEMQEQTDEYYYDLWRDESSQQVKETLVLQALLKAEQLQVAPEDLDAAVEKQLAQFRAESYYTAEIEPALREQMLKDPTPLLNDILLEKIHDRLALIGTGQAPNLPEAPEVPEAPESSTATEEDGETA